jgi:hypothetical protein
MNMTHVASFEIKVLNHGEAIGKVWYAPCYGFTGVYMQVILDLRQEYVESVYFCWEKNNIKSSE